MSKRKRSEPSRVLSVTLPVKPSVTITSAGRGQQVPALEVADELERPCAGGVRAGACVSFTSGVPLVGSSPMESRPTLGRLGAEAGGDVGGAHLGELHEHGRRALGVGAGVDQHGRRAARGGAAAWRCTGRTTPGQPAHAQQRRGHGRPGVAGRDHGGGLAVAHQLGGADQRGVLLAAHPAGRVLVHGDDLGAGDEVEALGVADLLGRPDQHDARCRARSAARRAPSTISPGALSPPMASTATGSVASVSGDGRSPRRLKSVDLDGLATLVPAAAGADDVRGLGRLAVRAHAARRPAQTPAAAWWLRPLALDFFFLGTAMDGLQRSVLGSLGARCGTAGHSECKPSGTATGARRG